MSGRCHYCGRFSASYFGTPNEGGFCCDRCELRIVREEGGIDRGVGRILDELAPNRDKTAGKVIGSIRL